MRFISTMLVLVFTVASPSLVAGATPKGSSAEASADKASLITYLLGNEKSLPDAEARRQNIVKELELQDAILDEAIRLGIAGSTDVTAKMELARRAIIVERYWQDFFAKNPLKESILKDTYKELTSVNNGKQYRLSQIVVTNDDDARKVLAALKSKAAFAKVAAEFSKDAATKPNGGDLGWRWMSDLLPQVRRVLDFLKPGEYTEIPVLVPGGLVILRLEETRPQALPDFDKIRPELENSLRLQIQQQELARMQKQSL
ncbi:MAG: peptidylprolyl isomerase [Methylotenera sp.]|nr:peptidylprolyl isomerase [Methylotenera sp.]